MELGKLRTNGMNADGLAAAVQHVVGARLARLQSREARVTDYAARVFSGESLQTAERYEQAIRGVTLEQMKSVLERQTNPAMLRIAILRAR
jgi:predicted Zn-dependent peptidase